MQENGQININNEEPYNGSGRGCLFLIILAALSVATPFFFIWIANLIGFSVKYDIVSYLTLSISIGILTVLAIYLDVNKKERNENSHQSNQ